MCGSRGARMHLPRRGHDELPGDGGDFLAGRVRRLGAGDDCAAQTDFIVIEHRRLAGSDGPLMLVKDQLEAVMGDE